VKHLYIYIYIYIRCSLAHSWSWALPEKPPVVQLLKNFPAFYGARRFITVFTRAIYWFLSWGRSIPSIPSNPISLRSILILSTHLCHGLPSRPIPSGFLANILYAFLFAHIRATCPAHLQSISKKKANFTYFLALCLLYDLAQYSGFAISFAIIQHIGNTWFCPPVKGKCNVIPELNYQAPPHEDVWGMEM
jgi:hypothetical protein